MLMTINPTPALRQTQTTNTLNLRYQANANENTSGSAANLSQPASLGTSSGDGNYFKQNNIMNGIMGSAPPGTLYVRALYDYEADDRTSLSFHEGDVIQVITQLESGWWDGVINGVRGWFPSNYCQTITSPDEIPEAMQNGEIAAAVDDLDDQGLYEDDYDRDNESDPDDYNGLPLEGTTETVVRSGGADFWIPQATNDGRLFYYNTMTGESSMELPLESPTSFTESGPRDRMNVNIPEKTRPPPEMMARGLTQDEDEESDVTSSSELEGESSRKPSHSSLVSHIPAPGFLCVRMCVCMCGGDVQPFVVTSLV